MNIFAVVLTLLVLMFVGVVTAQFVTVLSLREEKKYLRQRLLAEESKTQRMLNMMLARDLPQLAGLNQIQTPSKSSGSEYIPRDDVTEFNRLNAMSANSGFGEPLFDFDDSDPELNLAIQELTKNGQVDYNEEVI